MHNLDELAWNSDGLLSIEELKALGNEIAGTEEWIVDGYFGWTASLAEAADVIVLVQVPLRTALWRIFWRHLKADLRRDNRHPGWINLFRFMRVVRRQYLSIALPDAEHEAAVSQRAIEHALQAWRQKVLVNPSVAGVIDAGRP